MSSFRYLYLLLVSSSQLLALLGVVAVLGSSDAVIAKSTFEHGGPNMKSSACHPYEKTGDMNIWKPSIPSTNGSPKSIKKQKRCLRGFRGQGSSSSAAEIPDGDTWISRTIFLEQKSDRGAEEWLSSCAMPRNELSNLFFIQLETMPSLKQLAEEKASKKMGSRLKEVKEKFQPIELLNGVDRAFLACFVGVLARLAAIHDPEGLAKGERAQAIRKAMAETDILGWLKEKLEQDATGGKVLKLVKLLEKRMEYN